MSLASLSADERAGETRERIVTQAEQYFRQFGYQKTTVADIARALRMSPANVYRFFDSKKAINEAVASRLMGEVEAELAVIAAGTEAPPERLRRFARAMHQANAKRYVGDRFMHEMVAVALDESWNVVHGHIMRLDALVGSIIADGLRSGDFSVQNPAVASRCVHASLVKFCHPMILSQCAQGDPGPDLDSMVDFILRGLGSGSGASSGARTAS